MKYKVYIDESGNTPYYNDKNQPVTLWGGVITTCKHSDFDEKVQTLLKEYKINEDKEMHASPIIQGESPFDKFNNNERNYLLYKFILLGKKHIKKDNRQEDYCWI